MSCPHPFTDDTSSLRQCHSRRLETVQIVYIVGPSKCGTSWVQTTLDGHPNAVAWAEGAFASWLGPGLRRAAEAFNDNHAKAGYRHDFRLSADDVARLTRAAYDLVLAKYLAGAKPGEELLAVIDKTPTHAFHVRELASVYPTARFILVTRDPRDAAVSWWHFMHFQGKPRYDTIEACALAYAAMWGDIVATVRGAGLGERLTEITYESYKADPSSEIRRLLAFIGLPATDDHVNLCLTAGDFSRQTKGRRPGEEARSFHRKGVVGDWNNYLSPEIGERVTRIAAEHANRRETIVHA